MRINRLYAAMLALGMADGAHALGLGDLNLASALFQPLRADIELYGWDAVALEDLRVSLASQNAFLRAQVARPFFLRDLRMEIVQTSPYEAAVRITSRQPLREPVLEFLIDVEWPGGRLQKQYTVLLDPPVQPPRMQVATTTSATPAASNGATSAAVSTPPAVQAALVAEAEAESRAEAGAPPAAAENAPGTAQLPASYTVRSGDSLSRIADRLIEPHDITRDQLMLALLDANPRAFIRGNINGLKGGVELDIPPLAVVRERGSAAASEQVREQHSAWRQRNKPQATVAAAALPAPEPAGLRLTPTVPEPVAAASEVAAAGETGAPSALERELSDTRQMLYEREAELDVMRSRMAVYEAELRQLNETLAGLREEVARNTAVQLDAAAPPAPAEAGIDMMRVLATLLLILGGFGLFSFLYRRFSPRAALGGAAAEPTPTPLEINQALDEQLSAQRAAFAERQADEQHTESRQITEPGPAARDELSEAPTEVREIMADTPPGTATADRMLVEADVLIQFGFFERGRELMQAALSQEPENASYRLKLMELCHAVEDRESFLQHATVLHSELTVDNLHLWQTAVQLATTLCPDEPLFKRDVESDTAQDAAVPDATPAPEPSPVAARAAQRRDPNVGANLLDNFIAEEISSREDDESEPLDFDGVLDLDEDQAATPEVEFRAPSHGADNADDEQPQAAAPGADDAEELARRTREFLLPEEEPAPSGDDQPSRVRAGEDGPDEDRGPLKATAQWNIVEHREQLGATAQFPQSGDDDKRGQDPDGDGDTHRWVAPEPPPHSDAADDDKLAPTQQWTRPLEAAKPDGETGTYPPITAEFAATDADPATTSSFPVADEAAAHFDPARKPPPGEDDAPTQEFAMPALDGDAEQPDDDPAADEDPPGNDDSGPHRQAR